MCVKCHMDRELPYGRKDFLRYIIRIPLLHTTVYVIGKATLSNVDIIPVNFYVDDDDVEDILADDDFDEEEAFPESGDVDVKVINKSEKEAVSEETVKSEDGFKPADNADTTEDSTETINLEEVK